MTSTGRPDLASLRLPPGTRPDRGTVAAHLASLGVVPLTWSNGPRERYASHEHRTTKLLMCAEGEITFVLDGDTQVRLLPGEGFVLPPSTRHAAVVGARGVTCVEGHRP